MRANIHRTI